MKKVALVFVVAVLLPSLVFAWLAGRSLRDQQFLLERQQSLLCQHVTDALAQNISDNLAQRQQEFSAQVESLVGDQDARTVGANSTFKSASTGRWPRWVSASRVREKFFRHQPMRATRRKFFIRTTARFSAIAKPPRSMAT